MEGTKNVVADDPRAGSTIGGCLIEEPIGRGGMGVVYRAEQVNLKRKVAIKLISPDQPEDEVVKQRFQQEARLAASLDHPNIVPVHEAGEDHGVLYITMQYVAGSDLGAEIATQGNLDPRRAARITAQVGAALDAAHAKGMVHRDIKPANVLLVPGDEEHAYLTDFGLTKLAESTGGFTRSGNWVGTVDYIAPEELQGQRGDARSDVYSLGCLLYEAVTGRVPHVRDTDGARMWAKMQEPYPVASELVPELPPAFDAVFSRALDRDPEARYRSAGDLGRAALAAVNGRVVDDGDHDVATGAAADRSPVGPPVPVGARTRADAIASFSPQTQAPAEASAPAPLPWRKRHRKLLWALEALIAAILLGAAAAALIAMRLFDGGEDRARSALKEGRSLVTASASSARRADKLREIRVAGNRAKAAVADLREEFEAARKLDDGPLRRATTAALTGEQVYLTGMSQLAELRDSNLEDWAPIKTRLERGRVQITRSRAAIARLELGSQRDLLPSSAALAAPIESYDDLIPNAARRLKRWQSRLVRAKARKRAELGALESYSGAMRQYLRRYDGLRGELQSWINGNAATATWDEVYTFLGQAREGRARVKDGIAALTSPGSGSAAQSRIVDLLGQSVTGLDRAIEGMGNEELTGTRFDETPAWQDFRGISDQISSQMPGARSSWESGVAAERRSIEERPLPKRPDV